MMVKTLVLDLDGTLVDCKERHYACYRDILQEHHYHPIDKDNYWKKKRDRVDVQSLLKESNASSFSEEFDKEWQQRIESQQYLKMDHIYPDVKNTLSLWREQNKEIILITLRKRPDNLYWQLDQLNFRQFFDHIVTVSEIDSGGKKSTAIKEYLVGKDPKSIFWIGDTESDILAAQEIGCLSFGISWGIRTEEILQRFHPNRIADNIKTVYQAMLNEFGNVDY